MVCHASIDELLCILRCSVVSSIEFFSVHQYIVVIRRGIAEWVRGVVVIIAVTMVNGGRRNNYGNSGNATFEWPSRRPRHPHKMMIVSMLLT